ncbi:MAG: HD domain-containing protein [Candidatus Spechtbacterales bacterium]
MQGTILISKAVEIAARAHAGQTDKAGNPYIEHPLRVMLKVKGDVAKAVAALHDVLEDTDLTVEDLRAEDIPEEVIEIVELLTKVPGEEYEKQVRRTLKHPIAKQVKKADVEDNSSAKRLKSLDKETQDRLKKKYALALSILKE